MTGQIEPIFLSISDGPTDTVDYRNKQLIGYIMVLTLDGSPEVVAQAIWEIIFSEKKIRFVTALDLKIYPKQITNSRSLHTGATTSELPSNVSTMM